MPLSQLFLDESFNPYILFDKQGKALSVNTQAQYLLGQTDLASIFTLATSYAPISFGFKRSHLTFDFGHFSFFAIEVAYETEDEIGIMLYKKPTEETAFSTIETTKHESVNIYSLIDLCISTNAISKTLRYVKNLDPSFPDVRIDSNHFIKYLNLILSSIKQDSTVTIKLQLKTGEYLRIDSKKYPLFEFIVQSDTPLHESIKNELMQYSERLQSTFHFTPQKMALDLVLFT